MTYAPDEIQTMNTPVTAEAITEIRGWIEQTHRGRIDPEIVRVLIVSIERLLAERYRMSAGS